MTNDTSILNDAALNDVSGGFSFGSFFGFPSAPSLPKAPTTKNLFGNVTNYVVSHSPVLAVGRALKFW